jgi:hypothetical protein
MAPKRLCTRLRRLKAFDCAGESKINFQEVIQLTILELESEIT